MSLRIRQVALRAQTPQGLFGASIQFTNGLNIVRADNTSGKSTCLQSIIYALGLEGLWSPSHDIPLAHVMTDHIESDSRSFPVSASEVYLEIANQTDSVTIRRGVKNAGQTALVSTWNGALLSAPQNTPTPTQRDFFVRQPGAATSESGFHSFLSNFIGWNLPMVPRFQGGEVPLYMEAIFPLLYVEQKKGWSSIPARFPTYLQIREIGRRVVEFLLRLDSYEIEANRQRLKDEEADVRARWRANIAELESLASSVGAYVQGLPREPASLWPPPTPPKLLVSRGKAWIEFQAALAEERSKLATFEQQAIPTVGQSSEIATAQLRTLEDELARLEFSSTTLVENLQNERMEAQRLADRLHGIDIDIRRLQDAEKLTRLGSIQRLKLAENYCPTCDQPLSDTLASQRISQNVMPISENLGFLKEQKEIVAAMHDSSTKRIQVLELEISAVRSKADSVRSQIRGLRSTLTSDNNAPSPSIIQERIRLEALVRKMSEAAQEIELQLEAISRLASEWSTISARRAALPRSSFSSGDELKIKSFQELFIAHTKTYGFTSLKPESLSIDSSTFRPIHGGFELEFDLSASDAVRVIWSYLISLLEMARRFQTNHPGLLILDEPRQQSARRESLGELLRSASLASQHGQQVIIATSEDPETLRSLLTGVPHTLINFDGQILKPLKT